MPKTIRVSIKERDLRRMVSEEAQALREEVDPDEVRTVVNNASQLLKAAKKFKENSTTAMTNATTPHLDSLIMALGNMIEVPSSYVNKPASAARTVKLRRVD